MRKADNRERMIDVKANRTNIEDKRERKKTSRDNRRVNERTPFSSR